MQTILKYFPELPPDQLKKLSNLFSLYSEWNLKINVISRKDMEFFYIRHVLHSMSILKFFSFSNGTTFLDAGTGGGFPGIPLAICLPDCEFLLCDSIGKKMKVVEDVAHKMQLSNIKCVTERTEKIRKKFDFILGRAVTSIPAFTTLVREKISESNLNAFPNGILYLKGGDFENEISLTKMNCRIFQLDEFFNEDFFQTKKLVYLFEKNQEF